MISIRREDSDEEYTLAKTPEFTHAVEIEPRR